jgi:hypothetical protein
MAEPVSIKDYRLTEHARLEMARRQITEDDVAQVLSAPEQVEVVRPGREVYQSRVELDASPKLYLLRVFIDVERQPPDVITAYRTSKIGKYWRTV